MKIDIYGIPYTIELVDEKDERLLLDDYYRAVLANRRNSKIYISNNLKNDVMFKRVLLHELTHAFIYASGMVQVEWKEENVADFIEAHLEKIYEAHKKACRGLVNSVRRKR